MSSSGSLAVTLSGSWFSPDGANPSAASCASRCSCLDPSLVQTKHAPAIVSNTTSIDGRSTTLFRHYGCDLLRPSRGRLDFRFCQQPQLQSGFWSTQERTLSRLHTCRTCVPICGYTHTTYDSFASSVFVGGFRPRCFAACLPFFEAWISFVAPCLNIFHVAEPNRRCHNSKDDQRDQVVVGSGHVKRILFERI
eukprot:SAG11_NODE_1205_length_5529_cov_6.569797_3_plen_194_part_00